LSEFLKSTDFDPELALSPEAKRVLQCADAHDSERRDALTRLFLITDGDVATAHLLGRIISEMARLDKTVLPVLPLNEPLTPFAEMRKLEELSLVRIANYNGQDYVGLTDRAYYHLGALFPEMPVKPPKKEKPAPLPAEPVRPRGIWGRIVEHYYRKWDVS
jgi:hypothetical protein